MLDPFLFGKLSADDSGNFEDEGTRAETLPTRDHLSGCGVNPGSAVLQNPAGASGDFLLVIIHRKPSIVKRSYDSCSQINRWRLNSIPARPILA
jgi:hypothetical protein